MALRGAGLLALAAAVAADPHPASGNSRPAPATVTIDLDMDVAKRWDAAAAQYKPDVLTVVATIKDKIPKAVLPGLEALGGMVERVFPAPFGEEMRGIAAALGIPVADVMVMNLFYDVTAACTSIVAAHANGTIYHGRNLDYGIPGLQNITVNVEFTRGGAVEYVGTTYVGYLGLLTGMRPGAWSVSLDERDTGAGVWQNLVQALLKGGKSIGFFLRETLEGQGSFDAALPVLQSTPLIAPSYIIAGGSRGQAAIVTRDRAGANDTWQLDFDAGRWFLVETNYDHWVAPPAHDNRRDPANTRMAALDRSALGTDAVLSVLEQFPNLNAETTYTTVMSSDTGAYATIIRNA